MEKLRWAKIGGKRTVVEMLDGENFLAIGTDETYKPSDFRKFEWGDYLDQLRPEYDFPNLKRVDRGRP